MTGTLRDREDTNASRIETNCSTPPPLRSEEQRVLSDEEDSTNFVIPVYKKVKIRICKELIPLRLVLFLWYGAVSITDTFLVVFFKQKGLTVTELSTIYLIVPVMQFFGPMISGIIADKIGSSKPVLIGILLLNAIIMFSILMSPDMNVLNCDPQPINLECHDQDYSPLIANDKCDVSRNVTELSSCNLTCIDNVTQHCYGRNLICDMLERNEDTLFSLFADLSSGYTFQSKCYHNITALTYKNITYSECTVHNMNCAVLCLINPNSNRSADNSGRIRIFILNAILLVLILTVTSTACRILDVTSMAMVKDHNSDFGRERAFSMSGIFVFSVFSGYLVTATTNDEYNDHTNYATCLCIFIGMVIMLLVIIYKLELKIRSPGENMCKKSLYLLKNPDVISFVMVLTILGSACGFRHSFLYWYLEGLGTSGFLLGLINGLSALCGLPFLVKSNWFIKKIGTIQLFLLGLCGYVVKGIGYYLLHNPWFSLFIVTTEIVTYHLLWVAVIVHSHNLAPEGLTATIISTAGGFHYGLGEGAGTLIGGLIMDSLGGRMAFASMAIATFSAAVLYAIYLFWRNKRSSRKLYFDHMSKDKVMEEIQKDKETRY